MNLLLTTAAALTPAQQGYLLQARQMQALSPVRARPLHRRARGRGDDRGLALAQQPVFLRDLSIRQAAAGHATQVAVVVVVVVAGTVILFPSLALLFRLTLAGRLGHARPTTDESAPYRTRREPPAGASARVAVAAFIAGVGFLTVADSDWAHAIGVVCFLAFVAFAYRAVLGGDLVENAHSSSGVRGVGPADRTGKPRS